MTHSSDATPYVDPRIAALYDLENQGCEDTQFYVDLAAELGAERIVDIGCGTGVLACELARRGHTVIGVEPAAAMLDVARERPEASRVRWIHGDASHIEMAGKADLILMTGNVAQEIHRDEEWATTIAVARRVLVRAGHLAFESRNPQARSWERWTPERTRTRLDHPTLGAVDVWYRILDVRGDLVRFEAHNRFASSGEDLVVVGVLRFRSRSEIEGSLAGAGFDIQQVFGDWGRGSVTSMSPQLIFLARAPG
jgi:SAM-dependent methyltransferase